MAKVSGSKGTAPPDWVKVLSDGGPSSRLRDKDYFESLSAHAARLASIGVRPGLAKGRYLTATPATLAEFDYSERQRRLGNGLLIRWWDLRGRRKYLPDSNTQLTQFRADATRDGEKYTTPPGAQMGFTVHPVVARSGWLKDRARLLWFGESVIKADALVARRQAAIGMNGIWGHSRDGQPVPDFETLAKIAGLKGRTVYLVTDSDVYYKEEVQEAWLTLALHLEHEYGARVGYICPPPGRGGKKVGVDDFLAKQPLEALRAYYTTRLPETHRLAQGPWPKEQDEAMHGIAGEIVDRISPHTEADPMALLGCLLVESGNFVGYGPYAVVGAKRHPAREYLSIVGRTALSRKGTAQAEIDLCFMEALGQPTFREHVRHGGLSSAEGLIGLLQDMPDEARKVLFVEEELSSLLIVKSREGNTLAPRLSTLWDNASAAVYTRKNRLRVEDAHVSLITHTTIDDLRQRMPSVDWMNGFANRILWLCAESTEPKPEGKMLSGNDRAWIGRELRSRIEWARKLGMHHMERTQKAEKTWGDIYRKLRLPRYEGMLAAGVSRADPHVLRLSLIYALLDKSKKIKDVHVRAAFAFWQYCEDSLKHIFGSSTGDPVADRILEEVRLTGGLTLTQIGDMFGWHTGSPRIQKAVKILKEQRLVRVKKLVPKKGQKGRPTTWLYPT